jgi:D-alanine-D-alanine ligase
MSQSTSQSASLKKKVAVLFGGHSPEHDVSIVTGLQVLDALDPALYDAFPVYLSTSGEWLMGDKLRNRNAYVPVAPYDGFDSVTLKGRTKNSKPAFVTSPTSLFGKAKIQEVDFALLAFHGTRGEDGAIQGMLEVMGVPYSGMRTMAASVFMDKVSTKYILAGADIPILSFEVIRRPERGLIILASELQKNYPAITFPVIVKPVNLGSSIGVAKANNWEELSASLPAIFKLDTAAILEPFVPNLVEYNIAVSKLGGRIRTSAIERPKHSSELLDFKSKYLSGGSKKTGSSKQPGQSSEGMLSLTRDINPQLPEAMENNIRKWASETFERTNGTGAPRIDFLCNNATGELWLNELNACPGSFGYFLWEAAHDPINFSSLLDLLIEEGEKCYAAMVSLDDLTPEAARLFPRKKAN